MDYTQRVIEAHTLQSTHLGEERTVKVFLPPGYDKNGIERYPVMYCHDGLEFFTHGRVATIATERIAEGHLRPMFIVGIAVNKQTRTDDYGPDGRRHDAYCRFVTEEVIPFIESHYRIERDAQHRWMAGISLGAAATLSIHLQHPHLIQRTLLFSGAFYETSRASVRAADNLSALHTYLIVGRQETEVEISGGKTYDFYRANQTTRNLLEERGATVRYKEADGKHIWGFWQRELPDALDFVEETMSSGV